MAAMSLEFGGRGRGKGRWRGRGGRKGGPTKEMEPIPEDQIEPLKVYVGNLRQSVTDHDLRAVFSHYATVVNAFIVKDKNSRKSRGFGFVKVATSEDVEKLLALKDGDRYINGQAVIIKPAKKKAILPGDYDYVRIPISDRLFDLDAEDPSEPCIHILVDDVMYKILELLPLKTLIGVEGVCRRWQRLIHKLFARRTSLNLCRETVGLCGPLSRTIVGKLLILSGPTLRDLKVQNVDYSTRNNILRMIAQLCPELQCLDVTQTMGINFSNLRVLTKGCRKLKTFIAEKCPDFDDRSLKEVLESYPHLEHLNIGGWFYEGKDFNILPETLKEFKISLCHNIKLENLKHIGDKCPNLEVLNMYQITPTKSLLDQIGTKCTFLKELKVSISSPSVAEGLLSFKNLKTLEVDAECYFEIFPMIKHMTILEEFSVKGGGENLTMKTKLDFSVFKKLRSVNFSRVGLGADSLKTLAKCSALTTVQSRSCNELTPAMFLDILRGCTEIVKFWCSDLALRPDFVKSVNDIMKPRAGPITLAMHMGAGDFAEEEYDTKKIKLERVYVEARLGMRWSKKAIRRAIKKKRSDEASFQILPSDDTDEDDDYDDYDNDSSFSGGSLDEYWMYGYGSDNSLPDDFVYRDHFEFLEHHLGLFEVDLDEDILPYMFD